MALDYAGEFNDGRTAARTPVTVRFGKEGLELEGEDGAPVASWAYEDLSLADEPHRRQPVRLAHAAQADARLTVADRGFLRPLLALAPHLRRRGVLGRRPWLRLALGAGGVVAGRPTAERNRPQKVCRRRPCMRRRHTTRVLN